MEKIVTPLLEWFFKNKRDLPWRLNKTPYTVYISEIMLQQTRVEAVKPYYQRFISALPDIYALANASDDILFKLWEGLGYYSRAKNLRKCAQIVVSYYQGEFPKDYKEMLNLPGIGMYTAGAILSQSYQMKIAAVDGNVLRVFSRLFEDDRDILKDTTKRYYKELIEPIMPDNPGSFNEALMELGATICMPKIAKCDVCPLSFMCKAYKNQTIFDFPKKKIKNEKVYLEYDVLFITDGNKFIFQNKKDGVLKGLKAPILLDRYHSISELYNVIYDSLGILAKDITPIKEDKHIFSHQLWNMRAYKVYTDNLRNYEAYNEDEIKEKIGLPTAYRKFLDDLF